MLFRSALGVIAPNRCNRRHNATRGLEDAFDGSEYENTTHPIVTRSIMHVAQHCNICYKYKTGPENQTSKGDKTWLRTLVLGSSNLMVRKTYSSGRDLGVRLS